MRSKLIFAGLLVCLFFSTVCDAIVFKSSPVVTNRCYTGGAGTNGINFKSIPHTSHLCTGGTGGIAGSTGGSTGGTAGSTGGSAGSTGGASGSAGGAAGSAGGAAGSVGGTGGTGGTTGGAGNCGNGTLDPGEQCDGSAMDNQTCPSLGFSGGSLSCSASCEFVTSSCTGAGITPTISVSRSSCTAPCSVFFDVTSTTGLSGTAPTPGGGVSSGDYVGANWDWDFNDPTSLHKSTVGFVTAHVFDNPGTYNVSVVVHDLAGNAGFATQTITVGAMSGTTYYVSTSGSDGNNGLSMTHPFATIAHALSVGGSTNNSILLRRGDTWSLVASTVLNQTGPFLIGAYTDPLAVSALKPEIDITLSGAFQAAIELNHPSDIRFTDLKLNYTNSNNSCNIFALETATTALFERLDATFNTNGGTVWNADTTSDKFVSVDSNLHDFNGYGYLGISPQYVAIIGTIMSNFTTNNHAIRVQGGTAGVGAYATNTYIAENTITPNVSITGGFGDITERGDNTKSVVVNNYFKGLGAALDWEPQNTSSVEHVINGLCEGNTLIVPQGNPFKFTAQHIVIRNNLVFGMDFGVDVIGDPQMPAGWTTDINIYNNTQYNPAVIGSNVYFARQIGTTGNMVVTNNILYTASSSTDSAVSVSWDALGTITASHNLIYSPHTGTFSAPGVGTGGVVASDPKFVSNGVDFRLQSSSPAVDSGVTLHAVWESFNPALAAISPLVSVRGSYRPQNTTYDIGAFERKNP